MRKSAHKNGLKLQNVNGISTNETPIAWRLCCQVVAKLQIISLNNINAWESIIIMDH